MLLLELNQDINKPCLITVNGKVLKLNLLKIRGKRKAVIGFEGEKESFDIIGQHRTSKEESEFYYEDNQ